MNISSRLNKLPCVRDSDRHSDWWSSDKYYPWYASLSGEQNPSSILEIGVGYGYSLVAMILGSKRVERVVGIDDESWWPGSQGIAKRNIASIGFSKSVALPKVRCDDFLGGPHAAKYDIVHIDACYSHIKALWGMVASGGIMIVDDTLHEASVSWHVEAARPHLAGLGKDSYLPSFRGWWVGKKA